MEVFANLLEVMFSLAVSVFTAICYWKIYEKLGEPGWKSLIPFYSLYTLYKSVWKSRAYFWSLFSTLGFLVSYVLLAVFYMSASSELLVASLLILLCLLFVCWASVISVILNYKIAKCFGRGIGFCIGLTLVAPVFLGILAFDDSCVAYDFGF